MNSSSPAETGYSPVSLTVENLGGIDTADLTLEPGVSILAGRNATNRTSLLTALGGVLGGTTASLKSDADTGYIEMGLNGESYRREYSQTGSGVTVSGTPYSDQETLVDLCVALFEDNPARRAVERGDDLREVIMWPVDTDEIQARIADLKQRRQEIEDELAHVEDQRAKLPRLKQKRDDLTEEIAALDDQLEELQSEVASYEADVDAAEEAADVVDELNSRRQELSSLEDTIEVKQSERDALEEDIADIEAKLEDIPDDVSDQLATVEDKLQTAQREKHELDDTIASLTTIVDFNDELLSEGVDLPGIDTDTGDVTSGLAPEDQQEVVCWTCGSQVPRGGISDRLDDLRSVIDEKRTAREEVQERLENLQSEKQELESAEQDRVSLERRLEEMEEKLHEREQTIEDLRSDREALTTEIDELEQSVAETEELRETDLPAKYERISELQYEQGQLQQQLDDCTDQIEEIESLPAKEDLESQLETVQDDLERERARVSDLETEAVDAFNEHMDELLETLQYENIARIWIEKKQQSTRGSSRSQTSFDLHIVRESAEGTGYEDRVENLSESEREVVGLVVALAGYLVHDVHEKIPFILLDSLEAIDAQRISNLVEYFSTYVPYLIIALLPEDAAALQDEHTQITADALIA